MNGRFKQYRTILRTLVLVEALLFGIFFAIGYVGEPFLPNALEDYVANEAAAERSWRAFDAFLTALDVLVVCLALVAWVALWRDWQKARFLYTLLWILSVPTQMLYPADISSGLSQFLGAVEGTVIGLVFGLLYFSDLRFRYEVPKTRTEA